MSGTVHIPYVFQMRSRAPTGPNHAKCGKVDKDISISTHVLAHHVRTARNSNHMGQTKG